MDRRLRGRQSWSGHKRLEEKSFACAEDRTLVVQSVADIILTELPQHLIEWIDG
jgi:hypothetical protein